jgi:hypothetical protein
MRARPAMAVTAVNATRPVTVPRTAARQLRVSLIASTMVKASTNSTADARNVAVATPSVGVVICSVNLLRLVVAVQNIRIARSVANIKIQEGNIARKMFQRIVHEVQPNAVILLDAPIFGVKLNL